MNNGFQFLKKLVVILCAECTFSNAYSQNALMQSGKILERKDFKDNSSRYGDFVNNSGRLNTSSVIFNPDKEAMIGFFADRNDSYNFIILQDYINFKEIRETKAEVPEKTEVTLKAVVRINDRNFLIYSQFAKSSRQTFVYVHEMSNNNVLLGSPVKVLTISEDKNKIYGSPYVKVSKNKKSILIYQATEGFGKGARRISCLVVDTNFSQVWQNDFDYKLPEKESTLTSVEIDDDGNLYTLLYKGKEKYQKASVFSYFWKNQNFTETPIGNSNEKAKTYGCLLKVVDGLSPVAAGIVDMNDELSYFAISLDPAKNSSSELVSAKIPENVKPILVIKKAQELYLAVQQIVKTTNNNLVFSIEENHEITHTQGSSSYTSFHSAGIFVVSVSASGIVWSNIIDKKQWVLNPFTSGHALISDGDNALVFYNDKDTNVGKDGDDSDAKAYRGVNTALIMQTIDPSGKMVSQRIATGQEDKFGINPNYFFKIADKLYHTQLFATTFSKYACAYATVELK